MKRFYVYALIDPITMQIRYIGKTHNLIQRYHGHMNPIHLKSKTHKNNWIKSLLKAGYKPIMSVLFEYESDIKALEGEIRFIAYFRANGAYLTNNTDGGQGRAGRKLSDEHKKKFSFRGRRHTEEMKKRMSDIKTGKKLTEEQRFAQKGKGLGRKMSDATKNKMSIAKQGYKPTDETKQKLREANLGKKQSQETKDKRNAKLRGANNPNYGKKASPEKLKKMSEARKGRFVGDKSPSFGKKYSQEHIDKAVKNHPNTKLSFQDAEVIRGLYAAKIYKQKELAKIYGVGPQAISKIINNQRWTKPGSGE